MPKTLTASKPKPVPAPHDRLCCLLTPVIPAKTNDGVLVDVSGAGDWRLWLWREDRP